MRQRRRGAERALAALLGALGVVGVLAVGTPVSAETLPPAIPPAAKWLDVVNYYRAMANLPPVGENPTWSSAAAKHACYMLLNDITHDEIPGHPGYTPEGDDAGAKSNVAVSSVYGEADRRHVELWMTGPFHAIGILRHNLRSVGFGRCDNQDTPRWRSGAALNVISGVDWNAPRPGQPILWPGNGTSTSLYRFITESPDPMGMCGWSGAAGLPVIAMLPEATGSVSASMSGPSGALQICTLHGGNVADGTARSILQGDNAVVVMPREPLANGRHTVTITTSSRTVTWSFIVDPNVAKGINAPTAPPPATSTMGGPADFSVVEPFRLVDSRQGQGTTRLRANVPARLAVAGRGGVPRGATAVAANFTAASASSGGYLSVYPCTAQPPNVSTVNFGPGEAVPNFAIVPLSSSGELCVVSSTAVELIVDVSGFAGPGANGGLTARSPVRLFDSRSRVGLTAGKLQPGRVVEIDVVNAGIGVPRNAKAVSINLTGLDASGSGFVTAFPCGTVPNISNLNLGMFMVRANHAIVPLSPRGTICLSSSVAMNLIGDVTGWIDDGGLSFTPLTPTRMVDTRNKTQPAVNAGTNGWPVSTGQVLRIPLGGIRGVPTDAKAVSVNITSTGPWANGYVTAWPCSSGRPDASVLNPLVGRDVANGGQLSIAAGGQLCLYTSTPTHLIVDINGVWR